MNFLFHTCSMTDNLVFMTTPDEYISRLEDVANKDMFNPSDYSFDTLLKYLDNLIAMSKKCAMEKHFEDAYIGFRRFQIVLNSLQMHNLYNAEDERIQNLNSVIISILPNCSAAKRFSRSLIVFDADWRTKSIWRLRAGKVVFDSEVNRRCELCPPTTFGNKPSSKLRAS